VVPLLFLLKALGQCRHYLSKNYPDIELRPVASTALGAQLAAKDPTVLSIASTVCEEVYGLDIVDRSIQDAGQGGRKYIGNSMMLFVHADIEV
jgi:prephenate dehydratase